MSTALTVLREELGQQLGMMKLIPNGSVTAIATGSITAPDVLRDSNLGGGQYKGWIIYRPGAATSADTVRYAGLLASTSGLLAHTGANYADTTVGSEVIELWKPGARPDLELLASLNRVLEFEFISTMLMISHLTPFDGDMALATDTNWTDVGTTSASAKSTAAGLTSYGPRSYRLTNTATNSGTRSTGGGRVRKSGTVSMFAIAAAEVGTASLQPYDLTNTTTYGTAITNTERRPALLALQSQTVPATCELTGLNMLGLESNADIFWNQAALYIHDELSISLPSGVTEGFMAPKFVQAQPKTSIGTNIYDAEDINFIPLTEGIDYWLVINHADAEPYKVRFANPMPSTGGHPYEWPLFVEARIPQSSLITLSAETDVVNAPKHNLLPRWKIDCLETIWNGAAAPKHPDWDNQMALAQKQLIQATRARSVESIAPEKAYRAPRLSAS